MTRIRAAQYTARAQSDSGAEMQSGEDWFDSIQQESRRIWYCSSTIDGRLGFMKRDSISRQRPAQLASAHWAVSAVALAAVVAVQIDWDSLAGQGPAYSPKSLFSAVILATTAWLLATVWLHASLAHSARWLISAGRLRLHAVLDLAIAALAVVVIFQGHQSAVASVGLWTIPPALLAVSLPSSVVLGRAAFGNQPGKLPATRERFDWLRIVIGAALLVLLGWIVAATAWSGP